MLVWICEVGRATAQSHKDVSLFRNGLSTKCGYKIKKFYMVN
jgi:hypothetical protein